MQIEIVVQNILLFALVGGCILFTIYVVVKTCITGAPVRTERHGGTPRADDMTVTSSSYGLETSYTPAHKASPTGPFPIGGRVERPPTRSFSSYINPRTKSKENESKK